VPDREKLELACIEWAVAEVIGAAPGYTEDGAVVGLDLLTLNSLNLNSY
jgi:hypothetical protein